MNDRLREALAASKLDEIELATRLGVDPKTVERWIAGRVPYPRRPLWTSVLVCGPIFRCPGEPAGAPLAGWVARPAPRRGRVDPNACGPWAAPPVRPPVRPVSGRLEDVKKVLTARRPHPLRNQTSSMRPHSCRVGWAVLAAPLRVSEGGGEWLCPPSWRGALSMQVFRRSVSLCGDQCLGFGQSLSDSHPRRTAPVPPVPISAPH